jgi:hypothetical protein
MEKKKQRMNSIFTLKRHAIKIDLFETFYLDGNQENLKLEIFLNKKDKDLVWFEKPRVTIIFNYKCWNRPF